MVVDAGLDGGEVSGDESVSVVVESLMVIAAAMLTVGVIVGVLVRAWWDDRRSDRRDLVSLRTQRRARARMRRWSNGAGHDQRGKLHV